MIATHCASPMPGAVLGPAFSDYKAGYRFGQLGLDLVEQRGLDRFKARVYLVLGCHILPWKQRIRSCRSLVRRAFDAAHKLGDLTYAGYSSDVLIVNLLAAGDPLGDVQREAEAGLYFVRQARFGLAVDMILPQLQLIRTLRGLTRSSAFSMIPSSTRASSSSSWRRIHAWRSPPAGTGSASSRRASSRVPTLPPSPRRRTPNGYCGLHRHSSSWRNTTSTPR